MKTLRVLASAALALALTYAPAAHATEITVLKPPELSWEQLQAALQDGKLDVGDAVDIGFQALWSAASNAIANVELCSDANTALRDSRIAGRAEFGVTTTVLGPAGSSVTFSQRHMVRAMGDTIAVAPIIRLDPPEPGTPVIGKVRFCPRAAGTMPAGDDFEQPDLPDDALDGALRELFFNTEYGNIIVRLPDDIRAGDRISGTIYVEPNGDTDAQRLSNAAQLSGYAVEAEGQSFPVREGVLAFTVADAFVPLVVSGRAGPVAGVGLPIGAARPAGSAGGVAPVTQATRPIEIAGPFDGNAANTQATVHGQPAVVIAESPRQSFVQCPPNASGPVPVSVVDGAAAVAGQTSVIAVNLSTPRTTLRRGERSHIIMQLTGLQDVQTEVRVALRASDSVSLQGGNEQVVAVDPAHADGSGVYERRFDLRVLATGPFDVSAQIIEP